MGTTTVSSRKNMYSETKIANRYAKIKFLPRDNLSSTSSSSGHANKMSVAFTITFTTKILTINPRYLWSYHQCNSFLFLALCSHCYFVCIDYVWFRWPHHQTLVKCQVVANQSQHRCTHLFFSFIHFVCCSCRDHDRSKYIISVTRTSSNDSNIS